MAEKYVSIVGFKNYYDKRPFAIGTKLLCVKEPDNVYDSEAIKVTFPVLGTVGYIANSIQTKANGTLSAARVYEQVGEKFVVEVSFSTQLCRMTLLAQKQSWRYHCLAVCFQTYYETIPFR